MTLPTPEMIEKAARAICQLPCRITGKPCPAHMAEARVTLRAVFPDVVEECAKVADRYAKANRFTEEEYAAEQIAADIRLLAKEKT